ncbi:hypothetical protein PSAB_18005 [Paenibacillus sabinae T27]|uniref:Uncharacterized protein n=1 Tax=Paenibacillus sabinae T27 TaxID=1268072 RepID=X4ZPM9_9BACL|nr:hypothetical protein PSAB_18005 [Paenibacillus sabinae T27]
MTREQSDNMGGHPRSLLGALAATVWPPSALYARFTRTKLRDLSFRKDFSMMSTVNLSHMGRSNRKMARNPNAEKE